MAGIRSGERATVSLRKDRSRPGLEAPGAEWEVKEEVRSVQVRGCRQEQVAGQNHTGQLRGSEANVQWAERVSQ